MILKPLLDSSLTKALLGSFFPPEAPPTGLFVPVTDQILIHNAAFQDGKTKSELVTVDMSDNVSDFLFLPNTALTASNATMTRQPKYFDGTAEGINGNPAIKWDGSHVLNYGNIPGFDPSTSDWTIFVVLKLTNNSANKVILNHVGPAEEYLRTNSDTNWESRIGAGTTTIGTFDNDTPTILTLKLSGTTLTTYKNGALITTATKTPASRTSDLLLGARNDSGLDSMNGFFGEIIMYKKALSVGEQDQVEDDYLSPKWLITT